MNIFWPWPHPPVGVYFNMPFDEYLAIPALSNSGIKDLLVSGPNFWSNSWLNPFRARKPDTVPQITGRAYHKRVLEGSVAFYESYAPDFEDDGDPDVLRSGDDIKRELARIGAPISFKNKAEGAARLLALAPQKKVLEAMAASHRAAYPGREFLPAHLIREIELGAKAIECNPYLNTWLMGGYPEVTVVFVHQGMLFKARFDYLKIGAITDLKTVANERGRDFEKAIDYAIAGNKYIIQPAIYLPAAAAARELIAQGLVFGAEKIDPQWLELYSKTPVEEFRFIFHQKGQALCTEGRIYAVNNTELMRQGEARIAKGVARFNAYHQHYDDLPWVSMNPPQHIDYASLPSFINDL